MTKKDYVLIARKIKPLIESATESESQDLKFSINQFVFSLCEALKIDNPRFDNDKFLKACNLI